MNQTTKRRQNVVERQDLTVQAALHIGGLLVYHEIRWDVKFSAWSAYTPV